jgi:hypothetical protein
MSPLGDNLNPGVYPFKADTVESDGAHYAYPLHSMDDLGENAKIRGRCYMCGVFGHVARYGYQTWRLCVDP